MNQGEDGGARSGLIDELDHLRTILDVKVADEDIPVLQDEVTDDGTVVPILAVDLPMPARGATTAQRPPEQATGGADGDPGGASAVDLAAVASRCADELEHVIDAILESWVRETLQPELDALRSRLISAARTALATAGEAHVAEAAAQATPVETTHGQ